MRPINITFLASTFVIGGAETQIVNLVSGLDKQRYNISIVTLKERGPFAAKMAEQDVIFHSDLMKSKLDVRVVPKLMKILKGNKTDILYTLDHDNAMFLGRICAKMANVPVCLTVMHTTNRRNGENTIDFFGRAMLPLSDILVATAQGQRQHLIEAGGIRQDKLAMIYNGINAEEFNPEYKNFSLKKEFGIGDADPVAGILAAFKPEKAHVIFVQAAALVLKEIPNAHFLLVGDGVERENIERKISELNITENVHITGFRTDVPEILSIFEVSVLCSYPRCETFSLAILESMAAGKPIITTDVGSLSEMVIENETGFLLPCGDPRALAEPIIKLFKDTELIKKMGRAARRLLEEKFTTSRMVEENEKLFEQLLVKKGVLENGFTSEKLTFLNLEEN